MIYKITGLDRDSGEAKQLDIEAESERLALDKAFDQDVVVEKVEKLGGTAFDAEMSEKQTAQLERRNRVWSQHPDRKNEAVYIKPHYRDQVNQAGVIALGIFFGLLAFSCASPFVIAFVLAMLMAMGQDTSPG